MGGVTNYVWRNEARLTPFMAHQFDLLAADFFATFGGVELQGSSGWRLDQEQLDIWYARMVPWNQVNGRKVYSWRWWNGMSWARISPAGEVAQPYTSNHQIDVAKGRLGAIDFRDSGNDAGVTRFGTVRNAWLAANAPRFGFNQDEGRANNEAWHYRFMWDPFAPVPSGGGSEPIDTARKVGGSMRDGIPYAHLKNGRDEFGLFFGGGGVYIFKSLDDLKAENAARGAHNRFNPTNPIPLIPERVADPALPKLTGVVRLEEPAWDAMVKRAGGFTF